jgi:hypothetical protein
MPPSDKGKYIKTFPLSLLLSPFRCEQHVVFKKFTREFEVGRRGPGPAA